MDKATLKRWVEKQISTLILLGDSPMDAERIVKAALRQVGPNGDPTSLIDPADAMVLPAISDDDIADARMDWYLDDSIPQRFKRLPDAKTIGVPVSYQVESAIINVEEGGPGSGHHGHRGIPGQKGGSLPAGGGGAYTMAPEEIMGLDLIPDINKDSSEYSSELTPTNLSYVNGAILESVLQANGVSLEDNAKVDDLFFHHTGQADEQRSADATINAIMADPTHPLYRAFAVRSAIEHRQLAQLLREHPKSVAGQRAELERYGEWEAHIVAGRSWSELFGMELYRRGDAGVPIKGALAWSTRPGGANTAPITGGAVIIPNMRLPMADIERVGGKILFGLARQPGRPGEDEVFLYLPNELRIETTAYPAGFGPLPKAALVSESVVEPLLFDLMEGGPGSGHHGHRGIPGTRGGSLPSSGGGGLILEAPAPLWERPTLEALTADAGLMDEIVADLEVKNLASLELNLLKLAKSPEDFLTRLDDLGVFVTRREEFMKGEGWTELPPSRAQLNTSSTPVAMYNDLRKQFGSVGLARSWTAELYGYDKEVIGALNKPFSDLRINELLADQKALDGQRGMSNYEFFRRDIAQIFVDGSGNNKDGLFLARAVQNAGLLPVHLIGISGIRTKQDVYGTTAGGAFDYNTAQITLGRPPGSPEGLSASYRSLIHEVGHSVLAGPGVQALGGLYNPVSGANDQWKAQRVIIDKAVERYRQAKSTKEQEGIVRASGTTTYGLTDSDEYLANLFVDLKTPNYVGAESRIVAAEQFLGMARAQMEERLGL